MEQVQCLDSKCENNLLPERHNSWKYFLRQLFICSGVLTGLFMQGLCTGAPTVFIPQLRRETNATHAITDEMASWISSAMSWSGAPCVIILSITSKTLGRKISMLAATVDSFIAFIVFATSSHVTQVLISLIMMGIFAAAQIVVALLIITEYTSPKYRGIFLMLKCATYYWGIWVSNFIGTFFNWRNIGYVGLACACYSLFTNLMSPKSPYWLASQGRFEECADNHRWLKGCDAESEKELTNLINTQKEYFKTCSNQLSYWEKLKEFYLAITTKSFYKPVSIAVATGFMSLASGKLVCAVYALEILKKITNSESKAYTGMLILDGVTVCAMYLGCCLSKLCKRRTLLFVSSSFCIIILICISLYLYLIKLTIFVENAYLTLGLLSLFSVTVSCGPLLMSASTYAELIPVRSRNVAMCIIALLGKLSIGLFLKVSPFIFRSLGLHGTFLFFSLAMSFFLSILYKYLPETKDKTLQEILDSMKLDKKRENASGQTETFMKTRKEDTSSN